MELDHHVWTVWLKAWGAKGAISYAINMGASREEILRANEAALKHERDLVESRHVGVVREF